MEQTLKQVWGIDVSKSWLDISINKKVTRIDQVEKSIKSFIKAHTGSSKPDLVVLESTGGYEKLAMNCLRKAGILVHIAHPNRVRDYAKAKGCLAKTDKLDANVLEEYGHFVDPKCIRELPGDVEQELNALNSRLVQLKEMRHQECCRLGVVRDKQIKKSHQSMIKILDRKIEAIEGYLRKIIASERALSEKYKLLRSMKGVGDVLATTLIAELPELGKLTKKEVAALVRVAPLTRQSGKKTGKARTQYGRHAVRKVLYMAALVAAHHNPKMKVFYKRLLDNGKLKKVALVAVMRKMIVTLNAMVKTETAFVA